MFGINCGYVLGGLVILFGSMSTSSSYTDDTSSSNDDEPPPTPATSYASKVMCFCTRCVGLVVQHAWKAEEHIQNFGRHNSQTPGASSSREVPYKSYFMKV